MARVAALLALLLLPALYARGTDGAAISNGDEAIYAQMAREMRRTGDLAVLRWDGEPQFARPPAAVWALAAGYALLGDQPVERPVRWVNAVASAAVVALTILLGAALASPAVGLTGGALLATADLFAGYGRLYESEPLLLLFVVGAFLAWHDPRARRSTLIVYGLCLGGALLTKQLVGLLPIAAPLAEALAGWRARTLGEEATTRARRSRGDALTGLGIGLLVALPWHLVLAGRHGGAFVDAYLVQSLLGRATTSLLRRTSPLFYLRELFRSEGAAFALLFLAATLAAVVAGLRRGRPAELLVGGWGLGVLVVYSLARSRYDYYLLLAYPAFALAAAGLLVRLPLRPPLRAALLLAIVTASALLHLPRNLGPLRGEQEARELLAQAHARLPRDLPVYTFNVHPYAARVYADAPAHVFVENERDLEAARALARTGMPVPALLATPPATAVELARRPSLLLWPRARLAELAEVPPERLLVVGDAGPLRLFHLP